MGGKSSKAKIPKYYMSLHLGVCHGPVDALKAIWVGEKQAWQGNVTDNRTFSINKEGLFGGIKKEGGVAGQVDVMMGGEDQLAPETLVSRLRTGTPANTPGFRGLLSLLFRGGSGGFYWTATTPYIKPIWVTAQRIPSRELAPATAPVPRRPGNAASIFFCLDDSSSMNAPRELAQRQAVLAALDLIQASVESGLRMDVGIATFWNGGIQRPNVTVQGVQQLRNFVSSIWILPGQSTPFNWNMQSAVNWFTATANDTQIHTRVMFFITDGLPAPGASGLQAAIIGEPLISRAIPVDIHAINIVEPDTTYTSMLDNTPEDGVPVVTAADPGPLTEVVINALAKLTADEFDANPAHIIYECLTDTDWGMGVDPSKIDTQSFVTASARLWGERLGLFLQWQAPSSIEDFINIVLDHANGALFPHPRTGKLTLRLLRDDLDEANLKIITPDNAVMTSFSRKGWGETTNEIVVTWTNPDTEKEETVRAQDLANIAQQGAVISDGRNYHGVRMPSVAVQLADRELRAASAPLCSCEVEVSREFWDVVPFDGIKVTWPEHGLNELVMRVMKVSYGDSENSKIKLSLLEDVFSLPISSYVEPATGEWENPAGPPVPVTTARLMPAPAYMVSNLGIDLSLVEYPSTAVAPLAVNPTATEDARYDVMIQESTPSGEALWEEIGETRNFVRRAVLQDELAPVAESENVVLTDLDGPAAERDDLVLIGGDDLPNDRMELALVTEVGPQGELTLLRGALDTVPRRWPAGTVVSVTRLLDWDPLPDEVADQENVSLKFLTATALGHLEESGAPVFTAMALSRPSRPTRPGHFRVNGIGIEVDDGILAGSVLDLTWTHRNRLLEDAVMYRWDADSLPLEAGVTYRVESDAYDQFGALIEANWFSESAGVEDNFTLDLGENPPPALWNTIRVRVVAERDGEEAWQSPELIIAALSAPANLTAHYVEVFEPTNLEGEYISFEEIFPAEGLSAQDELVDNQHRLLLSGDAQDSGNDGIRHS